MEEIVAKHRANEVHNPSRVRENVIAEGGAVLVPQNHPEVVKERKTCRKSVVIKA